MCQIDIKLCRIRQNSKVDAFQVTWYMSRNITLNWRMYWLQDPNRHNKHCVSFLVMGEIKHNYLSFSLEGIALHTSHHWTHKNFTEVEGPWILVKFICPTLMHMCDTKKYKRLLLFMTCSNQIMSLISWINVIFFGRDRWWIFLLTKLWYMARELIYPWGKIIKVYCWSCQLKANCFWQSL